MRSPLLLCMTLALAACRERSSVATAPENPSLATFGAMQTREPVSSERAGDSGQGEM